MDNGFRLHIDIPLSQSEEESIRISQEVLEQLKLLTGVNFLQYRLSHDLDRGNKNYLDKNENGHCTNKKLKIEFGENNG
jgi:hypothetical protein